MQEKNRALAFLQWEPGLIFSSWMVSQHIADTLHSQRYNLQLHIIIQIVVLMIFSKE